MEAILMYIQDLARMFVIPNGTLVCVAQMQLIVVAYMNIVIVKNMYKTKEIVNEA
jgi:hypothetical protein